MRWIGVYVSSHPWLIFRTLLIPKGIIKPPILINIGLEDEPRMAQNVHTNPSYTAESPQDTINLYCGYSTKTNMYYVYLEVNIVIIVYMDLEFGYMDIDGILGRGFLHEKGVVVQFISVITLEVVLHAHIWCTLCVCWFYLGIYSTGFITFYIRVFCTFKTSHLIIFVSQLLDPLFF